MTAHTHYYALTAQTQQDLMQVFGETRVNVHALFEQLRREGDLTLVGAEAAISENKWKR